jgi:hypothetical protein
MTEPSSADPTDQDADVKNASQYDPEPDHKGEIAIFFWIPAGKDAFGARRKPDQGDDGKDILYPFQKKKTAWEISIVKTLYEFFDNVCPNGPLGLKDVAESYKRTDEKRSEATRSLTARRSPMNSTTTRLHNRTRTTRDTLKCFRTAFTFGH